MDQEARKELLRELCSLLPFGVMCWTPNGNGHLCSIDQTMFMVEYGVNISATKREYFKEYEDGDILVKPYLRPMSSMTDEETKEYSKLWDLQDEFPTDADIQLKINVFNWLLEHHFDFRGLIEKGLALAAPEDMYETE